MSVRTGLHYSPFYARDRVRVESGTVHVLIRAGRRRFAVRERASEGLVSLGRAALPMLKQALASQQGKDRKSCIAQVASNALRRTDPVLTKRRCVAGRATAAGSAGMFACPGENEMIVDDIRNTLTELVLKDTAVAGTLKSPSRYSPAAGAAAEAEPGPRRRCVSALALKDADQVRPRGTARPDSTKRCNSSID